MSLNVNEYGFNWGPMKVTRLADINGVAVLAVESDHHTLQISVSPKGRSVRIWKDHKEIK